MEAASLGIHEHQLRRALRIVQRRGKSHHLREPAASMIRTYASHVRQLQSAGLTHIHQRERGGPWSGRWRGVSTLSLPPLLTRRQTRPWNKKEITPGKALHDAHAPVRVDRKKYNLCGVVVPPCPPRRSICSWPAPSLSG